MTLFDKIAAIFMTQAEGEAAAPAGGLGQIYGVLPYLLIFGIIYVLVIRPTSKQRKEHQEQAEDRGCCMVVPSGQLLIDRIGKGLIPQERDGAKIRYDV